MKPSTHYSDQKLLQEFLDYNPPIAKQGDRWDLYLEFERQRIHRNIDAWIASERVKYWLDLWRDTGVLIYEKQPPVQPKYIIGIDPYQA